MNNCFILFMIFSISKMLLTTNGQMLYGPRQKDIYYQKHRIDSNIGPYYPTASYIKKLNEHSRKLQATSPSKIIAELNFDAEKLRPVTTNYKIKKHFPLY